MNQQPALSEYLVLSRGQWDRDTPKEDLEAAIRKFYEWYERSLKEGRMKSGSRLSTQNAFVSRSGIAIDRPLNEAKEVIGGYWFIVAGSLREAAEIAAQNPCAQYGLTYEIRPLEAERASAYKDANETPADK